MQNVAPCRHGIPTATSSAGPSCARRAWPVPGHGPPCRSSAACGAWSTRSTRRPRRQPRGLEGPPLRPRQAHRHSRRSRRPGRRRHHLHRLPKDAAVGPPTTRSAPASTVPCRPACQRHRGHRRPSPTQARPAAQAQEPRRRLRLHLDHLRRRLRRPVLGKAGDPVMEPSTWKPRRARRPVPAMVDFDTGSVDIDEEVDPGSSCRAPPTASPSRARRALRWGSPMDRLQIEKARRKLDKHPSPGEGRGGPRPVAAPSNPLSGDLEQGRSPV